MITLDKVLEHLGFAKRPQQQMLYDELMRTSRNGAIVQAGTGTGKSLAVLSAAAEWKTITDEASVIVTPTKVLMDQYVSKDVPPVAEVTGLNIVALKGRRNYLCERSPGMQKPKDDVEGQLAHAYRDHFRDPGDDPVQVSAPRFGCPGSKRHKDGDHCHAQWARDLALDADIVVTNLHMLIVDDRIKQMNDEGEGILPQIGALFVDEAHQLETVMRDFSSTSITRTGLNRLVDGSGLTLLDMIETADRAGEPLMIVPNPQIIAALEECSRGQELPGEEFDEEDDPSAVAAAKQILGQIRGGVFDAGNAVLHFQPGADRTAPKITSTWINLAAASRQLLTKQPVALVSATIPRSLPAVVGLTDARVVDVGHPFDYARQGWIGFSTTSGAYRYAQQRENLVIRAGELLAAIRETRGGCLLLFSAYRDLNAVYDLIAPDLEADGRLVLKQGGYLSNAEMAQTFKDTGNAVLFGSESFATGFDVPGDALELVGIWKLPYPGLDPVTKAISNQSFQRYEDMMLMKLVQAAGRLIRTKDDTGRIFIADSRGQSKIFGSNDPMVKHLAQFRRSA